MGKKLKDTDYLPISARIKIMETRLLTREQMDRLLDSKDSGDAAKLLQECGYPELDAANPDKLDAAMSEVRQQTMENLADGMPDLRYLDIFKVKYDYHNIKAILKAQAMQVSPDGMLMDMGRISASELKEAISSRNTEKLPSLPAQAIAEAQEVLETTRDPQLSDMVLDRWYYKDLCAVADEIGSEFLSGYVAAQIDAANLRVVIRARRMGKDDVFLKSALFDGGRISVDQILRALDGGEDKVEELYHTTDLRPAAEAGLHAGKSGALTEFEKLCDDAVSQQLSGAGLVPFGEPPLLRYLAARETEYTNLRMILIGRQAGIAPDILRTRLRASVI